jgi:hypothetical protein
VEKDLMGEEKDTHDERPEEERSALPSSPAVEAEAREAQPVEAATPPADDNDDEYLTVELSELIDVPNERELVDVPKEPELIAAAPPERESYRPAAPPERESYRPAPLARHSPLPPPVKVTKSLPTWSASIPPPPPVPSRSLPPPPLGESSTPLPDPPPSRISSPPDFAIAGTVPPLERPSKNRFERALTGKYAAAAAVLAALGTAGYFAATRGEGSRSEPSREVAAANVLTQQAPEPKPAPSLVATEPKKDEPPSVSTANPKSEAANTAPSEPPKAKRESSSAERSKSASVSPSNKTEPAAAKAEAPEAEGPKSAAQTTAACTLNLNTIPASHVTLDGRDLGMTPKSGVSVPPGTHVIMFANDGGKKFTTAQCKAGEQKTVVVRLPI